MAKAMPYPNVKVDYFNEKLLSSDGMLKLNIAPSTQVVLENGQLFTENPANRYLIVVYGATTRSIPAQTSPEQIVVMCQKIFYRYHPYKLSFKVWISYEAKNSSAVDPELGFDHSVLPSDLPVPPICRGNESQV